MPANLGIGGPEAAPDTPLVSVVITTYDRPALLERSIRSVLLQSFQDFEVLVVDDASPAADENRRVVEAFNDTRVRFIVRASNGWVCRSRNTGIMEARGRFIAFLDDDDEWLPGKLEAQLHIFERDEDRTLGAVIGFYSVVGRQETRPPIGQRMVTGWGTSLLLGEPHLQTCGSSLLIRREVVDAGFRFDPSFPAFEDWDFLTAISSKFQIETVPEVLFKKYEDFDGVHIWTTESAIQGHERIIEKYRAELEKFPRALADRRVALAISYARYGDAESCRRQMTGALALRPFDVRLALYALLSRFGLRPFLAVCPAMTARGKWTRVSKKFRKSWKLMVGRYRRAQPTGV